METRMDRHYNSETLERTKKNKDLYNNIYAEELLTTASVKLLDNENVIDINKVKEMVNNREEYQKIKKYNEAMSTDIDEEETVSNYDIYDDIESRIFDINTILENARKQRSTKPGFEKKLRNTQYDILNKLNLNEVREDEEEMDNDFFGKDSDVNSLFDQLKGSENTVVTKPIKDDTKDIKSESDTSFYTNVMAFTKDDFDELKDLKKTVRKNNVLIKVLITILVLAILGIAAVIAYNIFIK